MHRTLIAIWLAIQCVGCLASTTAPTNLPPRSATDALRAMIEAILRSDTAGLSAAVSSPNRDAEESLRTYLHLCAAEVDLHRAATASYGQDNADAMFADHRIVRTPQMWQSMLENVKDSTETTEGDVVMVLLPHEKYPAQWPFRRVEGTWKVTMTVADSDDLNASTQMNRSIGERTRSIAKEIREGLPLEQARKRIENRNVFFGTGG